MGRPRNPERDKSLKRYLESDGKITTKELAEQAGVPEARIRKWKSQDKWEEALKNKPRKRGGQKGNRNAAGKTPAKKGNKNAVTHGAYAAAGLEDIDPEKAEEIMRGNMSAAERMAEELQALLIRRAYLEKLIEKYQAEEAEEKYYVDKIVHMIVPKGLDDIEAERETGTERDVIDPDEQGKNPEQMKTAMKSVVKSSAFDRRQKVEAELNRIHGRIIKQLDSMKSYELERQRIDIEERRLQLAQAKATGAFDVEDEATEEIIEDEATEEV